MKWAVWCLILTAASAFAADGPLVVHTYDAETDELISTTVRETRGLSGAESLVTVTWQDHQTEKSGVAEAVLDAAYSTLTWKVAEEGWGTDYFGRRQGDSVVVSGVLRGDTVDETHDVGATPFFHTPTMGLEGFVRSEAARIEFYTLRPDNLSSYKMKAERKGPERIDINGARVDAVRVQWGLAGFRSAFYKRTFWFRASDGVFLRSNKSRGIYSQLGSG